MAVDHWCKLIQFVLSHFCPLENPDSYNPEGQKNKAVRADFRLCGDWSGFKPFLLSPRLHTIRGHTLSGFLSRQTWDLSALCTLLH